MTYSIIQKSQLEGALRLDAEYFMPEYLKLENKIKDSGSYKLWRDIEGRFIAGPFGSEFNVENYVANGEYRYVRGKDVKDFFLEENDNVYLPKKDFERLKKYSLREGDVLVSVVGTSGNTAIIDNSILPAIYSCKNTVFRTSAINPYYLITFLGSRYGKKLLERSVRGAVQTGLNIDDLKSLLVYIPDSKRQNEVGSLIVQSKEEIDNSKTSYRQAEDLLLEESGLKDFEKENDLFSIVNLSEVQSANRIDGEYYQPKFSKILKQLEKGRVEKFENCFSITRGKNFNYKEDGEIGVIKTKQLGKHFINFQTESQTNDEIAQKENLPIVKDRDVIFASMGVGSLGKLNIFYDFEKNNQRFTIDSTLKIFRPKNGHISPEVLNVYLGSTIGQELIYKYIVGSSGIISIYENYIKELPIPILPEETQQKIADLVRQSHAARQKSKQLLAEAKRKIEEMIERE